jgi:GNAT superfamily N-acetyltransferase
VATLRFEKLRRGHDPDAFERGREALNRFLVRYAFPNEQAGASQTYMALADEAVVAYYTLVFGQVEYGDAPERLTKGLARHPVSIMLLARLAVAVSWQGKGLGGGLFAPCGPRISPHSGVCGSREGRPGQVLLRTIRLRRVAQRPLSPVPLAQGRSRCAESVNRHSLLHRPSASRGTAIARAAPL